MVIKSIAIIPARGGSKRIPGKNILDFKGRPMIAWTIQAALERCIFDKVLVSTDSEEIAEISIKYGASVPFLRVDGADDMASSSQATIASLMQAEAHWNDHFNTVVQLMPNCPLRTSGDVLKAIEAFFEKSSNFQISVFRYGWMNPWWALKIDQNGLPKPVFKEAIESRSQDLEKLYCPTGAIWIANREALIKAGTFYGQDYRVFEMSCLSAIDIDDYDDLAMAECFADIKLGQEAE